MIIIYSMFFEYLISHLPKPYRLFQYIVYSLIGYCSFFIVSCENNFQKLQSSYDQGHYIEAVDFALEGLENPDLQKEIIPFLNQHGTFIIDELVRKGDGLYEDGFFKESIHFHKSAIRVLRKLRQKKAVRISNLEYSILLLDSQLEASITSFVSYNYEKGMESFNSKLYRDCISHMDNVQLYSANYKQSSYYLTQSRKLAFRHISITPLYHPSDTITQSLQDTLSGILTGDKHPNSHKMDLIIDGVNVPEVFVQRMNTHLSKQTSEFIKYSIDEIDESIDNSHYYIEGYIFAEVQKENPSLYDTITDTAIYSYKQNGEIKRDSTFFHYDMFKIRYTATVSIRANLYMTASDNKVKSILFSKSAEVTDQYRGEAYDLPPLAMYYEFPENYKNLEVASYVRHRSLIKQAIDKAAQELTTQLLTEVDKDLDPYTLFLESEGLGD